MRHILTVAVVIPIYNPPNQWESTCLEHIISLQAYYPQYRFLISLVNDGSTVVTCSRLKNMLKKIEIPCITYNFRKNEGKGRALRRGVRQAMKAAHRFICIDWDFPFGVLVIGEVINNLNNGFELVVIDRGQEYLKTIPPLRSILTRAWRVFVRQFFDLRFGDTQAGLKGFRGRAVPIFLNCAIDSFLNDLEFILACKQKNIKIAIVSALLRGGVKLSNFTLRVYLRELGTLRRVILK